MATATKEPPKKTEPIEVQEELYPKPTMPYVEVGMRVYWYRDGDRCNKPHGALVTDIGTNMIDVQIIGHGGGTMFHEGVRHINDPKRVDADNDEGAWEHTPFSRALLELTETDWKYVSGRWQ
jgi:hypothetical protein